MSRKRKIDEISQDEISQDEISQGEEPKQQVAVTIDEISQGEEPNQQVAVTKLNDYLNQIIEGQKDITQPPETARAAQIENIDALNNAIMALINAKELRQIASQDAARANEDASMAQQELLQIIQENMEFINSITNALAQSNGRLSRSQRIALNSRIIQLISDSVTSSEMQIELQRNAGSVQDNLKGLFNGLIEYYTEMASYGYERAPDILAMMGSIIAGTSIIGSAVMTPISQSNNILIILASYLQTATVTASGLYFLKQGGLPINDILGEAGRESVKCIRTGCTIAANTMNELFTSGLSVLGSYVTTDYNNLEINWDSSSGVSVAPSASSASSASFASSASSASSAIKLILDANEEQQISYILQDQLQTQPSSPQRILQNFDSQVSSLTDYNYPADYESDGSALGGRRKSRRHGKSKRTKNKRKCRKCRKTKKCKKHRKTLKRYKRKMRL